MIYIISGFLLGFGLGILFAALVLIEHLRAHREDTENHLYAALELSNDLSRERQKNEWLTEQVEALLADPIHNRDLEHVSKS